MDSEAYSESLQFQAVKKRAVASRSFRTKIPSSNGQNFAEGQTIQFDLPSNLAAQYYNFNQLYLRITIVNKVKFKLKFTFRQLNICFEFI